MSEWNLIHERERVPSIPSFIIISKKFALTFLSLAIQTQLWGDNSEATGQSTPYPKRVTFRSALNQG